MFQVFKVNGKVIAVSVDATGKIRVYDNVQAKPAEPVGSFEADGVSDFNHAMRSMIQTHEQI